MKPKKKNSDKKRWIAVGVAVILFVMSSLSGAIQRNLMKKMGEERPKGMFTDILNGTELSETVVSGSDSNNRILSVPVHGTIMSGSETPVWTEGYNHATALQILKHVKDDPTIKGVILDVNSPGGGVYESAEFLREVKKIQKDLKIPVYSVMRNMAASGGYYISASADKIYASPETTTGSIGVIMSGMNVEGLMEKLGVKPEVYKSGPNKDMLSGLRPTTEEEKQILQEYINSSYQRFVDVVAEGRGMDRNRVLQLADGRIYSGTQALDNGLIDKLGYYDDAVADMASVIGSDDPEVFTMNVTGIGSLSNLFRMNVSALREDPVQRLIRALDQYGENNAPRMMYLYGGDLYE